MARTLRVVAVTPLPSSIPSRQVDGPLEELTGIKHEGVSNVCDFSALVHGPGGGIRRFLPLNEPVTVCACPECSHAWLGEISAGGGALLPADEATAKMARVKWRPEAVPSGPVAEDAPAKKKGS